VDEVCIAKTLVRVCRYLPYEELLNLSGLFIITYISFSNLVSLNNLLFYDKLDKFSDR